MRPAGVLGPGFPVGAILDAVEASPLVIASVFPEGVRGERKLGKIELNRSHSGAVDFFASMSGSLLKGRPPSGSNCSADRGPDFGARSLDHVLGAVLKKV